MEFCLQFQLELCLVGVSFMCPDLSIELKQVKAAREKDKGNEVIVSPFLISLFHLFVNNIYSVPV